MRNQGRYACVYPVKVNQQRHVVQEVLNFGRPYGFGLEAGSKPELLAVAALSWLNWSVSEVILWSAVPGVMVLVVLVAGVREAPHPTLEEIKPQSLLAWDVLSNNTRRYLWVLVLFTFARVSESFILLRGNELGMSVVQLLLLWAALNLVKSAASLLGGHLADAFGKRRLTPRRRRNRDARWCTP